MQISKSDIGAVARVNGMNEVDPEGSYVRIVVLSKGDGGRQEIMISEGAAEILAAELSGVLKR
jgi:hypothetical protein